MFEATHKHMIGICIILLLKNASLLDFCANKLKHAVRKTEGSCGAPSWQRSKFKSNERIQ